jgi:hypothetical protein
MTGKTQRIEQQHELRDLDVGGEQAEAVRGGKTREPRGEFIKFNGKWVYVPPVKRYG